MSSSGALKVRNPGSGSRIFYLNQCFCLLKVIARRCRLMWTLDNIHPSLWGQYPPLKMTKILVSTLIDKVHINETVLGIHCPNFSWNFFIWELKLKQLTGTDIILYLFIFHVSSISSAPDDDYQSIWMDNPLFKSLVFFSF